MPADTTPPAFDDPESGRWNHHPGAIRTNPIFDWPPRPMAILRWYSAFWLQISTTTLCFVLAAVAYTTILPDLSEMRSLAPGWIAKVWLANLVPHCLIASALHYWFIMRKGQGDATKFDPRDQARKNGTYTFGNQVHDNMFWTIASGITQWTAFQVLVFWAMANGYAPVLFFPDNPLWFIAIFALVPMWSSFHFYWVHRALHWPPLYRLAHSLHHRNVNVGPWSGISMHPVEHFLFFTNFLIHFVVPSHPIHVMFHGYVQATHPVFSHSGFEKLRIGDADRMAAGVFFHQLHHRYFECNYGTVEMPWDRWFGSEHNGTAEATARTRDRKKRMHAAE